MSEKSCEKTYDKILRKLLKKHLKNRMKIPVNKKGLKLMTEICKDAPKKLVNNEGKNHVCLYNYFTSIYLCL